jgi:hypothetical protein
MSEVQKKVLRSNRNPEDTKSNTVSKEENESTGANARLKRRRRKYMRRYRYQHKINQVPPTTVQNDTAAEKPIDKQSLKKIRSSKTILVLRNMCDIRKSEKENSDRIKLLSRRVLRRFGHLFTPQEFHGLHELLTGISKQAEAIHTNSESVVESTQQILHHELIVRQFISRGIATRSKQEPRKNKVEDIKKNFVLKIRDSK